MTNFYEDNAREFFDSTVNVDMTPLYERFLPFVPPGGSILDAGCGSGRDALYFRKLGFDVIAMDASQKLCELAHELLGQDVHCKRFDEIQWHGRFDAIWASASLLHVPMLELSDVLKRLGEALKPGGTMYVSFKLGKGERVKHGRRFTDMNVESFDRLLVEQHRLKAVDIWETMDRRPKRSELWMNVILKKGGFP